jgi:hypothetical protein
VARGFAAAAHGSGDDADDGVRQWRRHGDLPVEGGSRRRGGGGGSAALLGSSQGSTAAMRGSNSVVGTGAREARRGDVGSAIRRRAAVGTNTRGPDSAFKARRGRVAAMRRRRADRRAWR